MRNGYSEILFKKVIRDYYEDIDNVFTVLVDWNFEFSS